MSLSASEQMNKGEKVFLEIVRLDALGKAGASGNEFRYSAWCEKCRAKVCLAAKDDFEYGNAATEALHVRLVFAGKLLVCRNSPSLTNGNISVIRFPVA
jgi:hypothetical protein